MPIGGYSYQPEPTGLGQASDGNQTGAAISPQEAVRVLSLRLPKRLPNSPIPSSLLAGAGGQGSGGSSSLNVLLQALMQAFGQSGGATGRQLVGPGPSQGMDAGLNTTPQYGDTAQVQAPTLPSPRITIGDDPNQRIPLGGDGGPTPRPPDTSGGIPAFRTQFGTGGGRQPLF